MTFIDFPEISFPVQGIEDVPMPKMYRIRQTYENDKIEDIKSHLINEMENVKIDREWIKGKSIAITVGSRGIPDNALMVRTICDTLKKWGAEPFIVPAMGSHGGGTVEGNLEIINGYGVTEEAMGVPIKASMEVVKIGEIPDKVHTPVYCDKYAAEADGIILYNKVKPHTDFKGYVESGMCKMMAIGLAKHCNKEANRHETSCNQTCPSCTFCTHRGESPVTIDEHPVQQDIQQVTTDGDEHGDGRVAESFQKLFAEGKQQKRHDGQYDEDVIGPCAGDDFGFLSERVQKTDTRSQ